MAIFQKRILSFLLLGMFVFYILPKEIVHAFTHHEDTEHASNHCIPDGLLEFSKEHHHCSLLKLDQQFHATDIHILFVDLSKPKIYEAISLQFSFCGSYRSTFYASNLLRGPPKA
jgi:hypothetical protein